MVHIGSGTINLIQHNTTQHNTTQYKHNANKSNSSSIQYFLSYRISQVKFNFFQSISPFLHFSPSLSSTTRRVNQTSNLLRHTIKPFKHPLKDFSRDQFDKSFSRQFLHS
ncbi:hypothetical protein EYC80_003392 [Monilinia laxa]|uniref:Uncharacterized protein n=1 Tax=Monilinia laxa TaxID=61186 RepID=A0A5N6KDQ1_MONLA|nr:hypothetical protein EYC80_003392 [Monilinia laxa]